MLWFGAKGLGVSEFRGLGAVWLGKERNGL